MPEAKQASPIPELELLMHAMNLADPVLLQQWLKLGFDVNDRRLARPTIRENSPHAPLSGATYFPYAKPLLFHALDATDHARETLLRMLLQAGANPNEHRDEAGFAALMHLNTPQTAALLIEYGADVNAATLIGIRPIHVAVSSGNLEIVELLYRHGADLGAVDHDGNTALHTALEHPDVCRWLIERRPELVNVRAVWPKGPNDGEPSLGETPLLKAISEDRIETAKQLVTLGADVNAGLRHAKDAFEMAELCERPELAQWMRAFQSAKNASDVMRNIAKSAPPPAP